MNNDNNNIIDSKTYTALIYNCCKNKNLRKYFIDVNLIVLPIEYYNELNKRKELSTYQLINLYNSILEFQHDPFNYDRIFNDTIFRFEYCTLDDFNPVSNLTCNEAKKLIEEELERKGIKINFEFYYNNYKNNLKKEGSKYAKYQNISS